MEIRGKSISFSSHIKNQTEKREKELIEKNKILESNLSDSDVNEIEVLKEDLKIIRQNKMQGILIGSRAQIIEEDEKATNFFCNLEKHNFISKLIPQIRKQNGEIITDQFQILNEAKLFYEQLYGCKDEQLTNVDLNDVLSDTETKALNIQESNKLEGLLTYEEAGVTLKAMKNNRSPGSDGFSSEFFKVFWKFLGHFVVKSINYGFIKGELSITQREGIITCIPKGNKPRHF